MPNYSLPIDLYPSAAGSAAYDTLGYAPPGFMAGPVNPYVAASPAYSIFHMLPSLSTTASPPVDLGNSLIGPPAAAVKAMAASPAARIPSTPSTLTAPITSENHGVRFGNTPDWASYLYSLGSHLFGGGSAAYKADVANTQAQERLRAMGIQPAVLAAGSPSGFSIPSGMPNQTTSDPVLANGTLPPNVNTTPFDPNAPVAGTSDAVANSGVGDSLNQTALAATIMRGMNASQQEHADAVAKASQGDPDAQAFLSEDPTSIMTRIAQADKDSNQASMWNGLAAMGAALAGSKNSHFGQAMGEAMMTGLQAWQQASDKKFARAVTKEDLGIEGQKAILGRLQVAASMMSPQMKHYNDLVRLGIDPNRAVIESGLEASPISKVLPSIASAITPFYAQGYHVPTDMLKNETQAMVDLYREYMPLGVTGNSGDVGFTYVPPYAPAVPAAAAQSGSRTINWQFSPGSPFGKRLTPGK